MMAAGNSKWSFAAAFTAAVAALTLAMVFSLAGQTAFADESASDAANANKPLTAAASDDATLSTMASTSSKAGWQKTKSGWIYIRKGKKVIGLQKIDGRRYYFNVKGIMYASDTTVGRVTFYIRDDGVVLGAKLGSKYYYDTLRPMTSYDTYDFETLLWARTIVDNVSKSSDSYETKLRKAFDWVLGQSYAIHRNFSPYSDNWTAVYARDHFGGYGGDCHSDGAAFAYLAAAIGYDADVCLDSMATGRAPSHCWTMIGSAVYDPLFAESKGYWSYYGVTSGTYQTNPVARYRVPEYSSANNETGTIPAALQNAATLGLKAADGKMYYYEDGKKVKNAWRTIDGKRYYFKKNGVAATGSAKVKGVYYVFNKKGVLQSSKESGSRVVKINDVKYRVNKSGKAMPGWSSDKRRYFATNGSMVKNAWKTIKGKRYYFTDSGIKAIGAVKVKKTNYVFSQKGVLQSSSKAGKRLVKIGSHVYQVDKKGRAAFGWNDAHNKYFGKSGVLLCGVHLVNGKLYAADARGVYRAKRTAALRAAAQKGKPAIGLLRLLGKPVDKLYAASCDFDGDDGLWQYKHFAVVTMRPAGAQKITNADLTAPADKKSGVDKRAGSTPTETIRVVEAL